jgi:hypothetical protein
MAGSHFHAEISLLAIEKSLFEVTANEARDAESRPVFAFYGAFSPRKRQNPCSFPAEQGNSPEQG